MVRPPIPDPLVPHSSFLVGTHSSIVIVVLKLFLEGSNAFLKSSATKFKVIETYSDPTPLVDASVKNASFFYEVLPQLPWLCTMYIVHEECEGSLPEPVYRLIFDC